MPEYNPNFPPSCPPKEAKPADGDVLRGIRPPLPITEKHFLSAVELNQSKCDAENCIHWGLSVWISQDDAQHARKIFPYMKKWYIAQGSVFPNDGVMLATPANKQPNHYTLWKAVDTQLHRRFRVVVCPVK